MYRCTTIVVQLEPWYIVTEVMQVCWKNVHLFLGMVDSRSTVDLSILADLKSVKSPAHRVEVYVIILCAVNNTYLLTVQKTSMSRVTSQPQASLCLT